MNDVTKKTQAKTKNPSQKKKIISICMLVMGIIALVVGVVFLVINLMKASQAADGDYLVAADNWVLEDGEGVIWDFTEIGKGTLTTNNHQNDYSFIWALEDGKLKIETDWLYNLENEYEYELDQSHGVLTLKVDDKTYKFLAGQGK